MPNRVKKNSAEVNVAFDKICVKCRLRALGAHSKILTFTDITGTEKYQISQDLEI